MLFNAGDHIPLIPLLDVVGNADKLPPKHIAGTAVKVGITFGLIVIVNIVAGPVQEPSFAVTVIVAICCDKTFTAVNAGIKPVPFAPKPIEVLLLDQVKVTPAVGLVKLIAEIEPPAHTVLLAIALTIGDGQLEETQFAEAGCAQTLPTGVIVIDTLCPALKAFTVNVVVLLDKVPVTAGPPFIE